MSLMYKALIVTLALSIMGCMVGNKRGGSTTTDYSCNSSACVESLCPGYSTASSADGTNADVCTFSGSCEIPNMPLTFQLNLPIPGASIVCGGATAQMIVNSVVSNSQLQLSGWFDSYSSITGTTDPTGYSIGYCDTDQSCRQVLSVGSELINQSWVSNPQRVTALEMNLFFEERATEVLNAQGVRAQSYESAIFPTNINECTFAAGTQALTNNHPWTYSILYLEYPVDTKTTSTFNGASLTELNLKVTTQPNGHYIAMKGFDTTALGISYKFHDPIYGVINYFIVNVKENEPVCITKGVDGTCASYIKVKQLPSTFNGEGTFLMAQSGEEQASDYAFKFIAAIAGITP